MKTIFLFLALAAAAFAQNQPKAVTVTIASAGSLSAGVFIGGCVVSSLEMDATWTAAAISFQGSSDGVTYKDLHNVSGEVTWTPVQGTIRTVDAIDFWAIPYLKVRSGVSGAVVNQAAKRTLKFLCR